MKIFDENFDIFEQNVMELLLKGDEDFLKTLQKQYAKAFVKKREYTTHGFYTYFTLPSDIEKLANLNTQFGDVEAKIEGLKEGVGFVLFIKDGKLDALEGYTYEEVFPKTLGKYEIFYIESSSSKRNLNKLKKNFFNTSNKKKKN